jgi:hypothetical protein
VQKETKFTQLNICKYLILLIHNTINRPLTPETKVRDGMTWSESELQEVRAVPVTLRSTTMWVRTDIHGNAHKLFSAIGLKPPHKVLHITKSENVVAQA